MSTTENKRSVIVGIFVVIGMIILIAGIFVLGGKQNHFARTVTVSTSFPDVAGLKAGNNVWFSGVKVGTVKAIRFNGLDEVEVELIIEEKSREFVRKDAIAKLGTDGFIGNKLILIEGGSPEVPAIENGDRLQPAAAGGMDGMMETLQVNNENFVDITEELKVMMSRLNAGQGTAGALLNDSLMADQISRMIQNLNVTAENTARASVALNQLTDKLNREGTLVNELLTDTVVYANLRGAVAQLQGITQTASALVGNLNEATEKFNTSDNAVGLMLNDAEMADRIRRTMENLESSTAKLDENMEALQHNFLFRGYFRRQARQADPE